MEGIQPQRLNLNWFADAGRDDLPIHARVHPRQLLSRLTGGKKPIATVFAEAHAYLAQGAHGLVYGRNIYQHPNPGRIVRAFMALIHEGATAERALAIYQGATGTFRAGPASIQ